MAMDQSTLDEEEPTDAGHPVDNEPRAGAHSAVTAEPARTAHPADKARLAAVPDPEAPGPREPCGGSRHSLLYALGVAVLLLAATCVASFTCTWTLPAPTVPTSPIPGPPNNTKGPAVPDAHTGYPNATRQDFPVFAKLLVSGASLKNGTLSWYHEEGIRNVHLSQGLRYNNATQELVVDKAGLYLVFLELKLSPTVPSNAHFQVRGQVSLTLQPRPPVADLHIPALTVEVFPCSAQASVVAGSWSRLLHLQKGHRLGVGLSADLHGAEEAHRYWELSKTQTTTFGLFHVNSQIPPELLSS